MMHQGFLSSFFPTNPQPLKPPNPLNPLVQEFNPAPHELSPTPALLQLLPPSHDAIDGARKVFQIMRIQTGHADAPVLGHVDVGHVAQLAHLRLAQPREREHADLVRDVVPGARGAELFEPRAESLPHRDDAPRHLAEVGFPLGEERGVVEDQARDARAVCRRVGDLGPLQLLQL